MNYRNIDRYISILYASSTIYIDRKLKEFELNKTKGVVLLHISQFDLSSQSDINSDFPIKKSAMTKIINALEKNNYVKRIPNKLDKRERLITLTEEGKKMIPVIKNVLDDWSNSLLTNMDEKKLDKLEYILAELVDKCNY